MSAGYNYTKKRKDNTTGIEGEKIALDYLLGKGYQILHTNWRWHHYELDITAIDGEMLVVVEVKTRSADYLISPEEAVDSRKIQRIGRAADVYVRYLNIDKPVRFDIIAIVKKGDKVSINHIEDAFYM